MQSYHVNLVKKIQCRLSPFLFSPTITLYFSLLFPLSYANICHHTFILAQLFFTLLNPLLPIRHFFALQDQQAGGETSHLEDDKEVVVQRQKILHRDLDLDTSMEKRLQDKLEKFYDKQQQHYKQQQPEELQHKQISLETITEEV